MQYVYLTLAGKPSALDELSWYIRVLMGITPLKSLYLDGNSLLGVLFDLFKAFGYIESSNNIFIGKDPFSCMHAQHVMSYHLI